MILAEFHLDPDGMPVALHPRLTVVRADGDGVQRVVTAVAGAIRAGLGDSERYESVVSTSGPDPVAEPADAANAVGDADADTARGLAEAEAVVHARRSELGAAVARLADAQAALEAATRSVPAAPTEDVAAAEAALERAQAHVAWARDELASRQPDPAQVHAQARATEAMASVGVDRTAAVARGARLQAEIEALGPNRDLAAVRAAIDECLRLEEEAQIPETRGRLLIQSWTEVQRELAAMPVPVKPPEWLVAPALAALQEARAAVAEARHVAEPADGTKVAALEAAHREVLDAEQRVMRKGSRTNRRRLEQAQEAERGGLADLGVSTYGDYLQRIAAGRDRGGRSQAERVRQAEAALADAEAVWEELHGNQATPEWTAAREREMATRTAIHDLLGDPLPDDELVAALEARVAAAVAAELAKDALETALLKAHAEIRPGRDIVELAEDFLDAEEERETKLADLRVALASVEGELARLDVARRSHQEDAFFGDAASDSDNDVARRQQALRDAEAAADDARRALEESRAATKARAVAEAEVTATHEAVERGEAEVAEARRTLDAAQRAFDTAKSAADSAPTVAVRQPVDASPLSPMETRLYLLARLSSLKAGAGADTRPVVVEARAPLGQSVLDLLNRTAGPLQLVVVTDDPGAASWVEGLGQGARLVVV